MRLAVFLIATFVLSLTSPTQARTWRVERDGSGDFTTIQPAINAASSGDLIEIGPGEFRQYTHIDGDPNYVAFAYVTKNLSITGAGMGTTVIGPADVTDFAPEVDVRGVLLVGFRLQVAELTIENIPGVGISTQRGRLEMDRCEIRNCNRAGVYGSFVSGGWIRDCVFQGGGVLSSTCALGFDEPSLAVDVGYCTFRNNHGLGLGAWRAGTRDIDIHDCEFEAGAVGVKFSDGASGYLHRCRISGMSDCGVWLYSCGSVVIEENEIAATEGTLNEAIAIWYPAEYLAIIHNVVTSSGSVLGIPDSIGNTDIRANHFLRTSDTAWWVHTSFYHNSSNPYYIHLENNYWGTNDTALLDQWIYDGNDNDDIDLYVDYLPLADGPVQSEITTWGALKSLFR
jgi:hypothetical protein